MWGYQLMGEGLALLHNPHTKPSESFLLRASLHFLEASTPELLTTQQALYIFQSDFLLMPLTNQMQRILRLRALNPILQNGPPSTSHFLVNSNTRAMATTTNPTSSNSDVQENSTDAETTLNSPLPLPEPSPESRAPTIDVSTGQGVKLDHLGPMIVNKDGTLSRISNWAQLSEIERRNTLRILGKRNQLRMEALKTEDTA